MISLKFRGAAAFVQTRSRALCSVKECMIRVVRRNRLLRGMKDNISKFDSAYQICARAIEYERVIAVSGEPVARVASIAKIKFQCFQILEEEVHNERVV